MEEKDLLLRDLCARLSYSVKGTVPVTITLNSYDINGFHEETEEDFDVELISINIDGDIEVMTIDDTISDEIFYQQQAKPWTIEEFTPYLRPMSSMTEEEKKEYNKVMFQSEIYEDDYAADVDWLNKHHFDYRGLIEKGLALEAPEGMYNLK